LTHDYKGYFNTHIDDHILIITKNLKKICILMLELPNLVLEITNIQT